MSIPTNSSNGVAPTTSKSASLSQTLRQSLSFTNLNHVGGVENVDSVILVYDLDRDETFFRLENHWLPLIERCYSGGVSSHWQFSHGYGLLSRNKLNHVSSSRIHLYKATSNCGRN
jgi:hypothetical protein